MKQSPRRVYRCCTSWHYISTLPNSSRINVPFTSLSAISIVPWPRRVHGAVPQTVLDWSLLRKVATMIFPVLFILRTSTQCSLSLLSTQYSGTTFILSSPIPGRSFIFRDHSDSQLIVCKPSWHSRRRIINLERSIWIIIRLIQTWVLHWRSSEVHWILLSIVLPRASQSPLRKSKVRLLLSLKPAWRVTT